MILEDCNNKHGDNHLLYEQISQVMYKIYQEVKELHAQRDQEILRDKSIKWTTNEVA